MGQSPPNDGIQRITDGLNSPAFLHDFNAIANINQVTRNIDPLSIHQKMVVTDEVPPLGARICEPQSINDIIQPTFEKDEQVRAGNSLLSVGLLEKKSELFFGKPVSVLDFLFFTQLDSIVRGLSSAALSMFTRRVATAIEGAFVGIAAVSL